MVFENYLKDLNRIDGEPVEFEWKKFPGFTTLGILEEIQKIMTELRCEPEQSKGRIILMSMYNDIVWRDRGNTENIMNSVTVANDARRFLLGRWSFLGPGSEKKCSDAETGSQQSDRADNREDPQVQHIEIKEVPRSSTLTR